MINKRESEIIKNWKGNKKIPVVSICCTAYNHEKYISEALDSFLMQETDFPFEVIVRDDASPDKTADIIREYEIKYPNIIKPIYERENGYQKGIKAMPVTFKKAIGQYIALCEGDDYWTDTKKLQIQKDFLDLNQAYSICYHNIIPFDSFGEKEMNFGGAISDLSQHKLRLARPIYTMTVMFRNIISIPQEFQMTKFGDLFIWVLLGEYGKGKYLNNICQSMYRIHDGGIFSKKTNLEKLKMRKETFFAIYSYYKNKRNFLYQLIFSYKYLKESVSLKYKNAK